MQESEMEVRYIALIGLIIGSLTGWVGFYIYRMAATRESGSAQEQTLSFNTRLTLLFERALTEFSRYPSKYIAMTLLVCSILLSIFIGSISFFSLEIKTEYLILLYLIVSFVLRVDSRVSIGFALLLLSLCPFLLIFDYSKLAETVAVYVWYFLAVGIVIQVFEYIREVRASEKEIAPEESAIRSRRTTLEQRRTVWKWQAWPIAALITFLTVVTVIVMGGMLWKTGLASRIPALIGLSKEKTKQETATKKEPPKKEPKQEAPAKITEEKPAATILVLNGNRIEGAAAKMMDVLRAAGSNVLNVDNADDEYPETTIYYHTGFDKQAQEVGKNIADYYPARLEEGSVSGFDADIVVVLGMDGKQ